MHPLCKIVNTPVMSICLVKQNDGTWVEKHQRFLFNVYKRFFIFVTFFTFLTFLFFLERFLYIYGLLNSFDSCWYCGWLCSKLDQSETVGMTNWSVAYRRRQPHNDAGGCLLIFPRAIWPFSLRTGLPTVNIHPSHFTHVGDFSY